VQNAREFANELLRNNRSSREELFSTISSGEAIAFVGAGLSSGQYLNYPTWSQLLQKLADAADEIAHFKKERIALENALSFAEAIKEHFKANNALAEFKSILCREYGPRDSGNTSRTHHRLVELPFRAFVTTNYDECLEAALNEHFFSQNRRMPPHPGVIIKSNEQDRHMVSHFLRSLVDWNVDGHRFIAHLHGCHNDAENIVLTESDYAKAYGFGIEEGRLVRQKPSSTLHRLFAWSLFATRRLVFFGCSMRDPYIKALLDAVAADLWEFYQKIHFVVLPIDEESLKSITNQIAEFRHYGLEPIFFDNRDGQYTGLDELLEEAGQVSEAGNASTKYRSEPTKTGGETDTTSLSLKEIGQGQKVDLSWLEEINKITTSSLKKNED
jgi:SIR2-like domain